MAFSILPPRQSAFGVEVHTGHYPSFVDAISDDRTSTQTAKLNRLQCAVDLYYFDFISDSDTWVSGNTGIVSCWWAGNSGTVDAATASVTNQATGEVTFGTNTGAGIQGWLKVLSMPGSARGAAGSGSVFPAPRPPPTIPGYVDPQRTYYATIEGETDKKAGQSRWPNDLQGIKSQVFYVEGVNDGAFTQWGRGAAVTDRFQPRLRNVWWSGARGDTDAATFRLSSDSQGLVIAETNGGSGRKGWMMFDYW